MKVIVSGAGIGGLALAQGLQRTGHEVVVFDKHGAPEGASGYRMRLDSRACQALGELLAPDLFAALLASGAGQATTRRLGYYDQHLRELATAREDDEDVLMVGRSPLRRLLLYGLDAVRWNTEVTSFTVTPDAATVTLKDGSSETGDLVVVSEGVHSTSRTQLLGGRGYRTLGVTAVAGRAPGTAAQHGLDGIAEAIHDGYILAFGARQVSMFMSSNDPDRGQPISPGAVGPIPPDTEPPYIVWGLYGPTGLMPSTRAGVGELCAAVEGLVGDWHPDFARLPGLSDPGSVEGYHFYASNAVPVWSTTAVTVLGDAAHAVPPTGGAGASTAIRDAGHLTRALAAVTDRATLLHELHRYEQTMRSYADDVVAESVRPLRWQRYIAQPAVHAAATGVLAGLHAVRRQVVHR